MRQPKAETGVGALGGLIYRFMAMALVRGRYRRPDVNPVDKDDPASLGYQAGYMP